MHFSFGMTLAFSFRVGPGSMTLEPRKPRSTSQPNEYQASNVPLSRSFIGALMDAGHFSWRFAPSALGAPLHRELESRVSGIRAKHPDTDIWHW
jgi:hypothetical protein